MKPPEILLTVYIAGGFGFALYFNYAIRRIDRMGKAKQLGILTKEEFDDVPFWTTYFMGLFVVLVWPPYAAYVLHHLMASLEDDER